MAGHPDGILETTQLSVQVLKNVMYTIFTV